MGFKSITFFSYIIPIIILGVPLSDTFFAIVRRLVHKKPIAVADKAHLHHMLLQHGLTHRQTVLMIYMMAGFVRDDCHYFFSGHRLGSDFINSVCLVIS